MLILAAKPDVYNNQSTLLSTLDLIDHMLGHHQEQALELVELALWHEQQAQALEVERYLLVADVTEVLRQAEEVWA